MLNRKSDDRKFELHGEYLHIYDTLTEIVNNEQTEYEGELYVIQTDLEEPVIESNTNQAHSTCCCIISCIKICLSKVFCVRT